MSPFTHTTRYTICRLPAKLYCDEQLSSLAREAVERAVIQAIAAGEDTAELYFDEDAIYAGEIEFYYRDWRRERDEDLDNDCTFTPSYVRRAEAIEEAFSRYSGCYDGDVTEAMWELIMESASGGEFDETLVEFCSEMVLDEFASTLHSIRISLMGEAPCELMNTDNPPF